MWVDVIFEFIIDIGCALTWPTYILMDGSVNVAASTEHIERLTVEYNVTDLVDVMLIDLV